MFSDDVYLEFGRAADLAQAFECELGTALLVQDAIEAGLHSFPDADAGDRLQQAIDRRTLGASLNVFRTRFTLDNEVENTFKRALEIRNSLMHGFFLLRFPSVQTADGNRTIVDELRLYQRDLERARASAGRISTRLIELFKSAQDNRGKPIH